MENITRKELYTYKNKICWHPIDNDRNEMLELIGQTQKGHGVAGITILDMLSKSQSENSNSFKALIVKRKNFIGRILGLLVLFMILILSLHSIYQGNNTSMISIYILPVVLTAIYYMISADIRFIEFFEISPKEKVIKRILFIIALLNAVIIQLGLYIVFPWYMNFTANNDIHGFVNMYNTATFMINMICMLYSMYRYRRYYEISLASIWCVEFGVFATGIFSNYIQRHASSPEGANVFILIPYIISVVIFVTIEVYMLSKTKKTFGGKIDEKI